MTAIEPLCSLLGINASHLAKEEYVLLETELFSRLCDELKERLKDEHQNYFQLMKWGVERESVMLETEFIRSIIQDILSTEEYTLTGIARYTDIPEDVLYEIVSGNHATLSAIFLRKIIDLHRSVRRELYQTMIKKIISEY